MLFAELIVGKLLRLDLRMRNGMMMGEKLGRTIFCVWISGGQHYVAIK